MDRILFGAAYYPEYMPCDRMEEDMAMMQKAGFNVIRIAESTWSTLEPVPGQFDFLWIDRTLAAAQHAGLSVIVGTPTYAVPPWLARQDPGVLATTPEGKNRYGHRQNMDITNPTFRRCAERVIRALVEHTARHPCVIGYQIDNETKYYDVVGPGVEARFREALQRRFADPEEMNRAFCLPYWSNAVHRWEDLPDAEGTVNAGYAGAFDAFRRSLAAEYLCWQREIVEEYLRPDQFITHNFDFDWRSFGPSNTQDGYSWGVQPGISHYEAAAAVTLAGTDIYHPTQDDLDGMTIAFGGDEIYALHHTNYLVCECQAQAFKPWLPYPGQLRLQGYSHIASGALGLLYWNWHSIHNGYETYWRGLLSHDLAPNPTYEEACALGRELARCGKALAGLRKNNRVALVVSNEALTALQWFPTDQGYTYNDIVMWMYEALYRRNIPCDVLFDREPDWSNYRMLVIPALYTVSEAWIDRLKAFVRGGGTVFASFRSFVANTDATVYADAQPHGLTDCFGMRYNQFTAPRQVTVGDGVPRHWMELLMPDQAETVLSYKHRHWGRYAACTRNRFGRGTAWYLGCDLSGEMLQDLLVRAAKEAGVDTPQARFPVVLRSAENAAGRRVCFLLHYGEEPCQTESPLSGTDLLTGHSYGRGEAISLSPWGVCILEEKV